MSFFSGGITKPTPPPHTGGKNVNKILYTN